MRRSDWAWPAGILVLGSVELVALSRGTGTLDVRQITAWSAAAGIAIEALACVLLVWRRRWPLAVALVVAAVMALIPAVGIHMDEPATPLLILALGMFAAGRYRTDRWAYLAPSAGTLAPFAAKWLDRPGEADLTDLLFIMIIFGVPFAFGRLALRQDHAHQREAARSRAEAIATERVRIARELHDVLAHSISSMVLQANLAADRAGEDSSAQAFTQIADTGRGALADVAVMLRLLRADDAHDAPNPTSADLPALVERFRRAGLPVDPAVLALDPSPRGAAVELSIYRVVQEALTNAIKHAGAGPTRLHVADGEAGITIEVTSPPADPADAIPAQPTGTGHGLLGMRERVEMFGGTLHAAPAADGSFHVRALIPHEATR